MRQKTSNRAVRRGVGALAAAALVAATALFGAGPARANNEFQNGFEDQLGRIAAFGAVNLGLGILTGGYYPAAVPVPVAPVVHYAPAYYAPEYYAPAYYGPAYPAYYAPRKVVVVKHKRHGKHHRKNHGRDW